MPSNKNGNSKKSIPIKLEKAEDASDMPLAQGIDPNIIRGIATARQREKRELNTQSEEVVDSSKGFFKNVLIACLGFGLGFALLYAGWHGTRGYLNNKYKQAIRQDNDIQLQD